MKKQLMRRLLACIGGGVLLMTAACSENGGEGGSSETAEDGYPTESIEYIVPYGAGGSTDTVSRLLAKLAGPELGQDLVILNKPGAASTLGVNETLSADPDGYTIGLATDNGLVFQPMIQELAWNSPDDYQPIIELGSAPFVLVVQKDAPWQTLEDFLDDAKARPGELRVAVSGELTPPDLIAQHFESTADVDYTTVPFSGGGAEALAALLGGHVEAQVESISGTISQIESGDLRPLVVFADARVPLIDDVPSAVELGYNTALPSMHLVVGPPGMAQETVDVLYEAFSTVWKSDEYQEFFHDAGYLDATEAAGPDEIREKLTTVTDTYEEINEILKSRS